MPVWSKTLSNVSQLQLLLKIDTLGDGRIDEYPKLENAAIQETDDTKTRSKRSADTEYDYYKDTDYYNYYGVENPVRCSGFDLASTLSAWDDVHLCGTCYGCNYKCLIEIGRHV